MYCKMSSVYKRKYRVSMHIKWWYVYTSKIKYNFCICLYVASFLWWLKVSNLWIYRQQFYGYKVGKVLTIKIFYYSTRLTLTSFCIINKSLVVWKWWIGTRCCCGFPFFIFRFRNWFITMRAFARWSSSSIYRTLNDIKRE